MDNINREELEKKLGTWILVFCGIGVFSTFYMIFKAIDFIWNGIVNVFS